MRFLQPDDATADKTVDAMTETLYNKRNISNI
jgi:hypothetical protein